MYFFKISTERKKSDCDKHQQPDWKGFSWKNQFPVRNTPARTCKACAGPMVAKGNQSQFKRLRTVYKKAHSYLFRSIGFL